MDTLEKLLELDDRHNELLKDLERLDSQITDVLKEWNVITSPPDLRELPPTLIRTKTKAA